MENQQRDKYFNNIEERNNKIKNTKIQIKRKYIYCRGRTTRMDDSFHRIIPESALFRCHHCNEF